MRCNILLLMCKVWAGAVQLEKYEVVPNQIQEKIVGANASKVAA
jgi:hypothetical protein